MAWAQTARGRLARDREKHRVRFVRQHGPDLGSHTGESTILRGHDGGADAVATTRDDAEIISVGRDGS